MRRITSLALLVALFSLGASAAHAKGPLAATITGDGVKGTLQVDLLAEPDQGSTFNRFVEVVGLFDLTFGNDKKVNTDQPTESLGKTRLVIAWDMTGGGDTIVQEVFPQAAGGPVTYVAPGQHLWEDVFSVGGWMSIAGDVATPLIELGVEAAALIPLTRTDLASKATTKAVKTPPEPYSVAASSAVPAPLQSSGGVGLAPFVALLVAAGIIGVGGWLRKRHPAPQ